MGRWTFCWVDSKTRVWWFPTRYKDWWSLYYLHDRAYAGATAPTPAPNANRPGRNDYAEEYDWNRFIDCEDEESYWLYGGWQFVGWEYWSDGNTYCTYCGRAPANHQCMVDGCGKLLCDRDRCHTRHTARHRFDAANTAMSSTETPRMGMY